MSQQPRMSISEREDSEASNGTVDVGRVVSPRPAVSPRPSASRTSLRYPRGTKVVEISKGRQFVSRPLDPRFLAHSLQHPPSFVGQAYYNNRFLSRPAFSIQNPHNVQHPPILHSHPYQPNYVQGRGYPELGEYSDRHTSNLMYQREQRVESLGKDHAIRLLPLRLPYQSRPDLQYSVRPPISLQAQSDSQRFNLQARPKPYVKPAIAHEALNNITPWPSMMPSIRTSQNANASPHLMAELGKPPLSQPLQSLFQKSSVNPRRPNGRNADANKTLLTQFFEGTRDPIRMSQTNESADNATSSQSAGVADKNDVLFDSVECRIKQQQHDHLFSSETSPRLLDGSKCLPSPTRDNANNHRGGIDWLFQAAVRAKTQSPLAKVTDTMPQQLSHRLSLSSPRRVLQSSQSLSVDSWEFNRAEDLVDSEELFREDETQRRRNPRYLGKSKRLSDIHIVMPISISYGRIAVEDPLGANFYIFDDAPKNAGAEILFGKGVPNQPEDEENNKIDGSSRDDKENLKSRVDRAKHYDGNLHTKIKPVCDVWASFLHVRLGTIYNLSPRHKPLIANLFKKSFDPDLCKFYVPISMDCRGIHPSSDDAGSSSHYRRAARQVPENREPTSTATERYETHAVPTSENDIKRLRMLRRHLVQFATRVQNELKAEQAWKERDESTYQQMSARLVNENPQPCIELHDNCRTDTIVNGTLKIVIREWSPLSDPEAFKRVWRGQLASPEHKRSHSSSIAVEVRTKLQRLAIPSARVLAGELRLEHTHLKVVDPRWPDELVPGRRVVDCYQEIDSVSCDASRARFVFCSRVPKPEVVYTYAEADGSDPRDAALGSRLSSMFKMHLAKHPTAGYKSIQQSIRSTASAGEAQQESTSTSQTLCIESCSASSHCAKNGSSTRVAVGTSSAPETTEGNTECHRLTSDIDETNRNPEEGQMDESREGKPYKPITSLNELKRIPEPFVPMLSESHSSAYHDDFKLSELLHGIFKQTSSTDQQVACDQSALKSDDARAFQMPLTTVACNYFLKHGCARGSFCHFLHPADPELESRVDVRHIVPKHPKFF